MADRAAKLIEIDDDRIKVDGRTIEAYVGEDVAVEHYGDVVSVTVTLFADAFQVTRPPEKGQLNLSTSWSR